MALARAAPPFRPIARCSWVDAALVGCRLVVLDRPCRDVNYELRQLSGITRALGMLGHAGTMGRCPRSSRPANFKRNPTTSPWPSTSLPPYPRPPALRELDAGRPEP